jgi:hypothetical protein
MIARTGTTALVLLAALLLPLAAPLLAAGQKPGGPCCHLDLCPKPPKQPLHRQGHAGSVGRYCPHRVPQPATAVRCQRHCSAHDDPLAPAPVRDDHRSPAIRFQARMSLPPRCPVSPAGAAALQSGFAEPETPPPRPLV